MTETLCENLRMLMFQENIKAVDLSKITSIPQATIHRMLSGESRSPHKSSLTPIANFFSVTVEQLLGESSLSLMNKIRGEADVPVFFMRDFMLEKPNAHDFTSFSTVDSQLRQRCVATTVEDDSMLPLFTPGTTIIIDPDRAIENGCYAVIKLDSDSVALRQVIYDGNDRFLKPLNPDITKYGIKRFSDAGICYGILVQAKLNF